MKVLVTGGGGFLGFAIVKQLHRQGHEVVSFSRSHYPALEILGIVQFRGNLSDYDAVRIAMQDCETVFHVAAMAGIWGSHAAFFETNVTGTQHVIRACLEQGVKYLIYTSSASVVFQKNSYGHNESLPYPKKFDAFYPQTKALAEQDVLNANGPGLMTCSLRPHLIWGPGDPHLMPRLFERHRKGQLRLVGKKDHLIDTIYLDNAARAHVLAWEALKVNPSVGGKAYFISQDRPVTIREFVNRILACGGLPPVRKILSPATALSLGWLFQSMYTLFNVKSEPRITVFVVKQFSSSHWYDISAAKLLLGYKPTITLEDGMNRLKAWVEAHRDATGIAAENGV